MTLEIGNKAPDFSLEDQNGEIKTLNDFLGKWTIIYFYPKDDTPGCTKEACGFRDNLPLFEKIDAQIIGVSKDKVSKHQKFVEKYDLPFTLLADVETRMCQDYGVWQMKKFMGREYMGIMRWTFIINPQGEIVKIYEKVKPATHADEILEDLKELQN